MTDRPETRIGSIELTISVPGDFPAAERKTLEKAVEACPLKYSFRQTGPFSYLVLALDGLGFCRG